MRSTFQEAPTSGTPSPWRVTLSVVSIGAGLLITAAIVTQIFEQVSRGTFVPENYFAFFSIQTSILNILVLLLTGIVGLQTPRDTPGISSVRGAVVAYSVITGVVYTVLLRDLVEGPGSGDPLLQWPIELTHVWIPMYLVIDWILSPHRSRISLWFLLSGLAYPAMWFVATEIRGSITGWYPYEFFNPGTTDDGLIRVLTYTGLIGGFTLLCLAIVVIINRIHLSLRTPPVVAP